MDRPESSSPSAEQAHTTGDRQAAAQIDLRQLADRVYQLMKADLRLARVRGDQRLRYEKR